jgi:RNA polymerase primary sigma factor
MTEAAVQETISISNSHVSLDAPIKDNSGSTLIDLIVNTPESSGPDENIHSMSMHAAIRQMLDTLTERERDIIKLYFGIDQDNAYTLDEIGRKFKITRERVRQIKTKALYRLKCAQGVQPTQKRRRGTAKADKVKG